ncbi:MAG TPA: hypothetical protein EYG68_12715 [Leucothrix mucor]|nr:hypothetical protein [Leucothrix mucor]
MKSDNNKDIDPSTEMVIEKKPKPKKKKKKAASAKGLETMFRNAYRAQLDMIALAATKANIMISLNGVIVSILMVTGGFIYAETPIFLLPAILFLITSAVSIYFALSSASPSPAPAHTRVFCCFRDVLRGKAKIRDLKDYVKLPEKRFNKNTSNILIFEDFARLPKGTYMEYMGELIKDPDTVYEKMSDQLYWLGVMADKKFTMLRYSYTVFRWGLILSIVAFLGIKSILYYFPHEDGVKEFGAKEQAVSGDSSILKFNNIYEPSGVQQLADGRLVIIEDESDRPFHILDIKENGRLSENKSLNMLLRIAFRKKLDDLEAITMGPDGFLYATTSHKRNKKGERKSAREQLIRFKIKGNRIIEAGRVTSLFAAIKNMGILGKVDKQGKGGIYNLNIEALSFDKNNRLMLCLRNPQIEGKSIILLLENPMGIFINKEAPKISQTPILLDLQGGGIRAMNYDAKLQGYLLTNEVYTSSRNNVRHSQISFWDGNPNHNPKAIQLPSLINMNNIEGISPVTINGKPRILLISDNGDVRQNRAANYLLLGYDQLTGD